MLMELIEKKNKPIKTKVSFTKKEWISIPDIVKKQYLKHEHSETKTKISFIFEGDIINPKKAGAKNDKH